MTIETYISIITLNLNGLNAPTKRHKLAEWIQKQDAYICCLEETHFRPKNTYRVKVKGRKHIFHVNGKKKKAGVAILISVKIDLKIKKITRDKEGHNIIIKGSTQEKNNNCKYLGTQHRSTSIHQTNTNRYKKQNRQQHNNSRRL